jgi:type IV pilus assembly protein PilQ
MKAVFPIKGWNKALKIMMLSFILCVAYPPGQKYFFDNACLLQDTIALAQEPDTTSSASFIKNIDVAEENGESIITIKASKPVTYTVVTLQDPLRIMVDLPEFKTESAIEPIVVNSDSINEIVNKQMDQGEKQFCRIEIGLNKEVEYKVTAKLASLIIRIAKDTQKNAMDKEVAATDTPKVATSEVGGGIIVEPGTRKELDKVTSEKVAEASPVQENTTETADSGDAGSEKTVSEPTPPLEEEDKVYGGQKISLDFKDADIRNILRLIADISGLNIIVSENVKGKVTIKLNDIPWDEVLEIVLETNNLGTVWTKSVMRIETREQIRKISEDKYRAEKSQEKVADLISEVVDIIYRDAQDIADLLLKEKELTSERGAITVDPNLNRLVLTDTPEKIDIIKTKIKRYDDRTVRQVFMEAKIIQSIPTFTKEIGIVWGGPYATAGNDKKTLYGVGGAGGVTFEKEDVTDPVTGVISQAVDVISNGNMIDLAAAAGAGVGGGIGFGILRDNFELTATLTAMEKDEKLKIISSPRILSIDKNEALIKQGVALPYLKLSEEGVTSTEFKDAVLELKVTPTILSEKIIKIEIMVKKDQKSAQTGAGGEPGIDVREAKTVLMVESGRTVVIGGIYEETTTIIKSGVPFFSDIPAVGRLFRNDFNKKELTELLIFLTTTIVPKEIIGIN